MIAKGTQHNNGAKLAQYLITGKAGEHAELYDLRGFAAADIKDAFRDVQIMAEGTKCEQPFFHVQVRNPTGEELTRDQWMRVADRIESKLGLSGQPRAIAFHVEDANGHEHMHVAWSRIDEDTMTAKHMPFFKERLKEVSRELEVTFGLTPVSSERDGPIKFGPTRAEEEQARRLGFDKNEVRNFIRDCYDRSDCGASFQAALEQEGFMLAQGDQRGLVVIDPAGGIHSLSKRILDVSAAKIRHHLSDLTREDLPTVENARALVPDYPGNTLQRLKQELAEVNKLIDDAERQRTLAALSAELAELDELILSHLSRPKQVEKPAPVWDRERDDNAWQEEVINAAIEQEKAERKFVEPRVREASDGGSREKELRGEERPLNENAADIRLAYSLSQSAAGFVENLEDRGIRVARVTEEEADRSHREAAFAKKVGRFAPEYREGEYVALNQRGHVYRLDPRTTGEERADLEKFMATLNPLHFKGIASVQKKVEAERQAQFEELREKERIFAATGPLKQDIADIRLAYALSQSPDGFARNLDEGGFKIARATKEEAERSHHRAAFAKAVGRFAPEYRESEYVAINERGHVYSLNRKTTGESREDIDAFMRTVDPAKIQGIEDTQQHIAAYKRPAPARELFPSVPGVQGTAILLPSHAQPPNTWQQFGTAAYEQTHRDAAPEYIQGPPSDIWTAFVRSDNARAFVAALREKNITVALVTRDDVAHSEIDRTYETNLNPAPTPRLRQGEYVVVTDDARIYNLNKRTTGESAERVQKFMAPLDQKDFQSVYATLSAVKERAALHETERQAFRDISAGHLKKPKDPRPTAQPGQALRTNDYNLDHLLGLTGRVGSAGARSVGNVLDVGATAFESLLAPKLTPEQIYEGEKSAEWRDVDAEQSIDVARYAAELSEQRRQQENEREAERRRDREGGGRER